MPEELTDVYAQYMEATERATATQAELDECIRRMHQLREQVKHEHAEAERLQRLWIMNI